jgi:hypothetical protein
MYAEKNNAKKKRSIVGCCDGTFEMIRDCFPDDGGYAACIARMKKNREEFCSRKDGDAAKEENQGCCY